MKPNKNTEAVVIALLCLTSLYLWSLPIQKSYLPYGEVDAVSHFTIADYTAQTDTPITTLPYFIDRRYGKDNQFIPHTLWYPPPFHINLAVAQIIGNERIRPVFLLNAVFSSCIVLIIYFVIRKMYGFWPALLSALLMMFSLRDINIYLWGQWPERISYYLTPLIIYCFYKYYSGYTDYAGYTGGRNPGNQFYLYIMSGLLAVNLYMHPVGLFHSIAALAVISLIIVIKDKKLPFNIKEGGIALIIFLSLASLFPLQTGSVLAISGQTNKVPFSLSRLFSWYSPPKGVDIGLPASHFSYKEMHGMWTLPFLLIGIAFLLLRRKEEDLFLIGWLISLYIMLHLDIIGKGRSFRSLSATAHIFYPIMAIGAVYLTNILSNVISNVIKLPKSKNTGSKNMKSLLKYSTISLFIILSVLINGKAAYLHLSTAYPPITRINPPQYEAAEWIKENIKDERAELYQLGAISQAKSRWEWMLSNRVIFSEKRENTAYAIIDYSDAISMKDQNMIRQIREYEEALKGLNKIYDKNNIKVYETKIYETAKIDTLKDELKGGVH